MRGCACSREPHSVAAHLVPVIRAEVADQLHRRKPQTANRIAARCDGGRANHSALQTMVVAADMWQPRPGASTRRRSTRTAGRRCSSTPSRLHHLEQRSTRALNPATATRCLRRTPMMTLKIASGGVEDAINSIRRKNICPINHLTFAACWGRTLLLLLFWCCHQQEWDRENALRHG